MIIDSFLFFQELDLLEVRLEYLYPIVDKFIIVEAKQNFKGDLKEYLFEKNIERYRKYLDKVYYHKIEDVHYDYEGLINFLKKSREEIHQFISSILESHQYYNKKNLSYVLDSYHRECIHIPLKKICNDKNIILISDLDEIPEFNILKNIKKSEQKLETSVCIQHEFQYYLNNYSNSDWLGSIISKFKNVKNSSLNELRMKSNNLTQISNAGYHFTSIGNKESITKKIESWAHQEFNHGIIKDNIEDNILNGKDIFYRFKARRNKAIFIEGNSIIDLRMSKILLKFEHLILKKIKTSTLFEIKYLYFQILFIIIRILKNPKKFMLKLFSFLVK